MTANMERVLRYLETHNDEGYISPTQIGTALVSGHSAWASPICLRLVKDGYAKRNKKGWYKAKPRPTTEQGKEER